VAAGADAAERSADPAGERPGRAGTLRGALLGASFVLLLLVGLSRPNAASPDLGVRGWVPALVLPLTLSSAAVTVALWAAYLLGGAGVLAGLLGRRSRPVRWWLPVLLALLALLALPFGSADHVNYAAYGRIFLQGGDPYVVSPIGWHGGVDPITSHVEAPWTTEPSVYGPMATVLQAFSAAAGGDHLRQVVWVWQVLVVLAWLGVRWLLLGVLDGSARRRVDVAWTLNPLVFGVGVLGAHVDVIGTVFAVAAVWLAFRWTGLGGAGACGAAAALAGCTKFTYAITGVAVLAAWWAVRDRRWSPRGVGSLVGAAAVVTAVLHAWMGPHVYDQLLRSRRSVSLATPWRALLDGLSGSLGSGSTRTLVSYSAMALAVVLALALLRLTAPRGAGGGAEQALRFAMVLSAAYVLAAPYSLPWYGLLAWAGLPAVAGGLVDVALLAQLAAMALAYVPGRVLGMSAQVQSVTLGVRRHVVPWVVGAVWVALIVAAARRGTARGPAPRPRG
jgi:hypothetical protein